MKRLRAMMGWWAMVAEKSKEVTWVNVLGMGLIFVRKLLVTT